MGREAALSAQVFRYAEDLQLLLQSHADLGQQVAAEQARNQLAYHDALTGLPNRRLLEDRAEQALAQARRDGTVLTVMYLDLDRFKPINDALGHAVGDHLLQQAAARMSETLREADTVARVGGDEFVILVRGLDLDVDLARVTQKLIDALSAPIAIDGHNLQISASVGCARFPLDGQDITTLLRHADIAMYAAKRGGGNGYFLFESAMAVTHAADSLSLGAEIWHALERQELHLVYQPQVAVAGSHPLTGCEALLRWRHPLLGDIAPDRFIPIAEANGAILPIGAWILERACAQLHSWTAQGLDSLTMSVNVSPRQLRSPDFCARLVTLLHDTGIAPGALALEITESEIMMHQEDDECSLLPLRQAGIKLAIDDFGTGYSSLSRLKHLPIGELKIDRSFVHDLETSKDAQAITACIAAMGQAMGLQVIAKGVETLEQFQILATQGCHQIQGDLVGPPMAAEAFFQWACARTRDPYRPDTGDGTWVLY